MKQYLLAVMMLISISAWAVDKDDYYKSFGHQSCGRYIEIRKVRGWERTARFYWVAGYITAYNGWIPDTYSIAGSSDIESIMLWLDNYCGANPVNSITVAMEHLIAELRPKRHRTAQDAKE